MSRVDLNATKTGGKEAVAPEVQASGWFGWFLLALLASSSGLAYLWPNLAGQDFDPFRVSSYWLWGLVSTTMFCLGTAVKKQEIQQLRHSPLHVFAGLVAQCLAMPLLAWAVTQCVALDDELAAGVILVGCVPGAMASNVLTMAARGNVSYSVSLTTVATMASPITVPILLWLLIGEQGDADSFSPAKTSYSLLCSVVIPVLLGFFVKELVPAAKKTAGWIAAPVASTALLWIIASVVAANRERLGSLSVMLLVALFCLNVLGYLAGWTMAKLRRMPANMSRALVLEVGMQNAGVGTALAATIYGSQSPAQIPTAAYTFGCMLTGTLLAAYWAGRGEPAVCETCEKSSGGRPDAGEQKD